MKNNSPWLHRYAIFAALVALIAIVLGAVVTSLERPIANNAAVSINPAFELGHSVAGGVAVLLMLGLAIALRNLLGIFLALGIAEGALGFTGQAFAAILHALIAQILFGLIVIAAVTTSASWTRGPSPIQDTWRPSLRSLAIAVPVIILLQTTLGASYRYHALGVLWHILNAMIVLLLNLIVAVFLVRQFPEHPTLRPAAVALGVITGIQVMLGFTTFMMLILFPETSLAVVITSVLHVTTGSLTFGAGLALAILIHYNIGTGFFARL
jgi:heme A synthase